VEGCRFVDEVVPGVPYVMDEDYLKSVMEKYKIDYVVHGDDPCIVNGRDVYELPQKMGKYRTIPRTEGISTTDIVGRMLLMSTRHHQRTMSCGSQTGQLASDKTPAPPTMNMNGTSNAANTDILLAQERSEESSMTFYRRSRFLTTSRMIRLFSAGMRTGPPHKDSKVVYMDGSWDMFHPGHIKTLKKIKHGLHLTTDTPNHTQPPIFLIIGVHNDQVVNQHRGSNFPIMNLHERVLSVLGCKYVDDVLIDAPYTITREMIASLNISLVLHGTHKDDYDQYDTHTHTNGDSEEEEDPFKIPKEMGIFQEISSDCDMSVREIIGRIQRNQEQYISKYSKKKVAEDAYYDTRYQTHTQTQKEGQAAAPPAAVAGNGKGR
jgi:ethanolamine-phosphate cytidylyltransferase